MERMSNHDGVITVRAGGNQMDGNARHLCNSLQISTGLGWEFGIVGDTHGGVSPAWQGFVNGFATRNVIRAHGQDVDGLTVQFIGGTQLEFTQAIQHIELGDAQTA